MRAWLLTSMLCTVSCAPTEPAQLDAQPGETPTEKPATPQPVTPTDPNRPTAFPVPEGEAGSDLVDVHNVAGRTCHYRLDSGEDFPDADAESIALELGSHQITMFAGERIVIREAPGARFGVGGSVSEAQGAIAVTDGCHGISTSERGFDAEELAELARSGAGLR